MPLLLKLTDHPDKPEAFLVPCSCAEAKLTAILDTGATCSVVSDSFVPAKDVVKSFATPIKVASGQVIFCDGRAEVVVELGNLRLTQKCYVMKTDAFKLVLGMDFIRKQVDGILLNPDRLIVNRQEFPLEIATEYQKTVFRTFRTESYQLIPKLKDRAILELAVTSEELNSSLEQPPYTLSPESVPIVSNCNVDLFASAKNRNENKFLCAENSAWQYHWGELGLCWANPPFSKIFWLLTKVALEEADVILVTPQWGRSQMDRGWTELLDKLTVRSVPLPDTALYIPEKGTTPLPPPSWTSQVTYISGRLRKILRSELNPRPVKKITKMNLGWGVTELDAWMSKHCPVLTTELEVTESVPPAPPRLPSDLPSTLKDDPGVDETSCSSFPIPEACDASYIEGDFVHADNFYLDLLLSEVDLPDLPVGEEVLAASHMLDGVEIKSEPVNPKDPWPVSKQDLTSLRAAIEERINFLEHEALMTKLRATWGTHADGTYDHHDDDDYIFVSYNLDSKGLEYLTYADLEDYDELFAVQKSPDPPTKNSYGESNVVSSHDFDQLLNDNFDPTLHQILKSFENTTFGPLPKPETVPKLVKLDLELKEEHLSSSVRSKPYPANQSDALEIERQVREAVENGLMSEYTGAEYPKHCSPCYLVDKPGSKARRLVVVYCKLNRMTKNHSGSLPLMENTCERMAKCRYKSKLDLRSGFWQVELTERTKDLLAFVTPNGRIYRWNVMPFGVSSAPAVFQELMNKLLTITKQRPRVRPLLKRGAELEVHIDDVMLGTNTESDHKILLEEFLHVCAQHHMRVRLEKCELLKEQIDFLGFSMGWGWWRPNPSKTHPLTSFNVRPDAVRGLKDLRHFLGAANFYRRHVPNFTYSSAILTDLTKKNAKWQWGPTQQAKFSELKSKIAACTLLGVPQPQGEIVLITDASDVGGGGSLFQWQKKNKAERAVLNEQLKTIGVTAQGLLKHNYPDDWILVPLGHYNWKWNPARVNYSTYDQELLAGVLTLASQARLIGDNPVLWLCDQEPLSSFVKANSLPPEERKRRRWWVFLTQFRLTVKHLPGIKNELCDFLSRENFDARLGEESEKLAREAFARMDLHLDLAMEQLTLIDTFKWWEYATDFPELRNLKEGEYQHYSEAMYARVGSLLQREGLPVIPSHRLEETLGWLHKVTGHPGPEKLAYSFLTKFSCTHSVSQLMNVIRSLPPCISCVLSKQKCSV